MDSFEYDKSDKLMLARFKRYEKLEVGSRVKVRLEAPGGDVTHEGVIGHKPDHMLDDFEIYFEEDGEDGGWLPVHIDDIIPV